MPTNGIHRRSRPAGLFAASVLFALVWMLVAGVGGLEGATQQGTLPWKPAPGTEDQYAGDEMCVMCHSDLEATFAANPHAGATAGVGHPSGSISCEACHGPGMPHADAGGDPELVARIFRDLGTAETGEACLACHGGARKHAYAMASTHAAADVACSTCHSIHQANQPAALLKHATPALCLDCHPAVKTGFIASDRHELKTGMVGCESCHNPHGSPEPALLTRPMLNGELCSACHLDKRGPFVYQHASGTVEGCAACHAPHGSPNRFMLKTNDELGMCVSCHPGAVVVHNLADTRYRNCTTCHAAIHGSDTHRLFFRR